MAYWSSNPLLETASRVSACCGTSRVTEREIHIGKTYTHVYRSMHVYLFQIEHFGVQYGIPAAGTLRTGRSAPFSEKWVACSSGQPAQMLRIGQQNMQGMAAQQFCATARTCASGSKWHTFQGLVGRHTCRCVSTGARIVQIPTQAQTCIVAKFPGT